MPGIVGFLRPAAEDDPAFLQSMARALEPEARFAVEGFTQEGAGLARVSLKIKDPQSQPVWNAQRTLALVMEGELFDTQPLRSRLQSRGLQPVDDSDAALLLCLYEDLGDDFAVDLNGAFVAAIWDTRSHSLILVNDRLGLHPLYTAQVQDTFLIGSGVRALLAHPGLSRAIDRTAIAEFMTFDHLFGQRTLLEQVRLFPQATVMKVRAGQIQSHVYWTLKYLDQYPIKRDEEYLEELNFLMRQAVQRQDADGLSRGLLLSGGLDSRVLLAEMAQNNQGRALHTFTWSIPNSDDARYAKEIARKVGADHHFLELQPDWLLRKAENCVRITDGMGNLVNLHASATLEAEAALAQTIFKGFLGDAMFGFGLRPRFWADYSDEDAFKTHIEAYRDYRVLTYDFPTHADLFTPEMLGAVGDGIMDDYRARARAAQSRQLANQRLYIDLTERVPRMTINGVEVVRDRAIVRLPFADNDLVEFSQTVPPHLMYQRSLATRAFIAAYPQLAKVPVTSTGLPMIACARELTMRAGQFLRWHTPAPIGKRLSPDKKPYKDYNLWFRTVLRPWMQETLLDPRCLERGYFRPEAIRQAVQDHLNGTNNAVKLGAMLAIETWHRQFIDDPKGTSA